MGNKSSKAKTKKNNQPEPKSSDKVEKEVPVEITQENNDEKLLESISHSTDSSKMGISASQTLISRSRDLSSSGTWLVEHVNPRLESLVNKKLASAEKLEPNITSNMKAIAEKISGELKGFDYRIKGKESFMRKATSEVLEERKRIQVAFQESKKKNLSESAKSEKFCLHLSWIVRNINDALRYTFVISDADYTDGVKQALQLFDELGYKKGLVKNYWEKGDDYQGINCVFKARSEKHWFPFEVQFHTPTSFEIKTEVHKIYSKYRVETDPQKKVEYFELGTKTVDQIPIPEGVLEIPELTKKTPPNLLSLYASKLWSELLKVKLVVDKLLADNSVNMQQLDVQLASMESIEHTLEAIHLARNISIPEAVEFVEDAVRYFCVFKVEEYTSQVKKIMKTLEENGFHKVQLVNYWADDELPYQGLHVVYQLTQSDSEKKFEIQFHTQETFTKNSQGLDEILEEYQKEVVEDEDQTIEEVMEVLEKMKDLWEKVEVPEGAKEIAQFRT